MSRNNKGPKVLIFDVETAPIMAYVWGLWENNVGLNQIKSDWHLLSYAILVIYGFSLIFSMRSAL